MTASNALCCPFAFVLSCVAVLPAPAQNAPTDARAMLGRIRALEKQLAQKERTIAKLRAKVAASEASRRRTEAKIERLRNPIALLGVQNFWNDGAVGAPNQRAYELNLLRGGAYFEALQKLDAEVRGLENETVLKSARRRIKKVQRALVAVRRGLFTRRKALTKRPVGSPVAPMPGHILSPFAAVGFPPAPLFTFGWQPTSPLLRGAYLTALNDFRGGRQRLESIADAKKARAVLDSMARWLLDAERALWQQAQSGKGKRRRHTPSR